VKDQRDAKFRDIRELIEALHKCYSSKNSEVSADKMQNYVDWLDKLQTIDDEPEFHFLADLLLSALGQEIRENRAQLERQGRHVPKKWRNARMNKVRAILEES
jgi:hypothetical protein